MGKKTILMLHFLNVVVSRNNLAKRPHRKEVQSVFLIEGKAHVLFITLAIALFPGSHDSDKEPETDAAKWNAAIIHLIIPKGEGNRK